MADTAAGFGATAETNDNRDQINQLLDQVRDLLAEDGVDYATAEALTNFARRGEPAIVGNLADLQRMGAIAVTGKIPADSLPGPGHHEEVATTNVNDAFATPPASDLSPAGLQTPMGRIDGDGRPLGGTEGDTGGDGGDLNAMTKAELADEADRRGVEVTTSMTKQEMIDAINAG